MSSGRKKLIAFLVLLFGGTIAYTFIFMDSSPPDVSDLKVEYENIPENENAFTYFEKAGQLLKQYEENSGGFIGVVYLSEYNAVAINNQLVQNQQAINMFQQGLMCKKMQVPKIDWPGALLPYLQPWRSFARLQSNRALHLFMNGQEQAAFNVLADTMRFGGMVQNSKGDVVNYFTGIAINSIARSRFRELIFVTKLPPAILKLYIKIIENKENLKNGFKDALNIEYVVFLWTMKRIEQGKISIDDFEKFAKGEIPDESSTGKKWSKYKFQPNRTKKIFTDILRTSLRNFDVPYNKITPVMKVKTANPQVGKGPNAQGKFLIELLLADLDKLVEQAGRDRMDTGATQLLIALKCYKMVNGALPDSLDKLVPNYIDSIPVDYYDGKPLRYSKTKRVIYSIGENLKDDGGPDASMWQSQKSLGSALWKEKDPGYLINF